MASQNADDHNSSGRSKTRLAAVRSNNSDSQQDPQQIVQRLLRDITHLSPEKQAAIGGTSGLVAGYCFAKASKALAFGIGASILGLALVKQSGFVEVKYDRLRDSAQRRFNQIQNATLAVLPNEVTTNISTDRIEPFVDQSNITEVIKNFVINNAAITSTFVGGFLLGLSFA